MNKFTALADEFLDSMSGEDIDKSLKDFVSSRGMTISEHQRMVEEVNVSSFLRKLDKKDHIDNYPLATPVSINSMEPMVIYEGSKMEKVASVSASMKVTDDMFSLSSGELEFTPSLYLDSSNEENLMNEVSLIEKESLRKEASMKVHTESEIGRKTLIKQAAIKNATEELVVISNDSPESARAVIVGLHQDGMEKIAEEVAIQCRYNTKEIAGASVKHLDKEAKAETGHAVKAMKNIISLPINAVKASYHTGKTIVKNPKTSAAIAGTGLLANKVADGSGSDRINNIRADMMLKTREGDSDV